MHTENTGAVIAERIIIIIVGWGCMKKRITTN